MKSRYYTHPSVETQKTFLADVKSSFRELAGDWLANQEGFNTEYEIPNYPSNWGFCVEEWYAQNKKNPLDQKMIQRGYSVPEITSADLPGEDPAYPYLDSDAHGKQSLETVKKWSELLGSDLRSRLFERNIELRHKAEARRAAAFGASGC